MSDFSGIIKNKNFLIEKAQKQRDEISAILNDFFSAIKKDTDGKIQAKIHGFNPKNDKNIKLLYGVQFGKCDSILIQNSMRSVIIAFWSFDKYYGFPCSITRGLNQIVCDSGEELKNALKDLLSDIAVLKEIDIMLVEQTKI